MQKSPCSIRIRIKEFELSPALIEKTARQHLEKRGRGGAFFELEIVGRKKIHSLNKEFMHKDRPTDVLSFPLEKIPGEKDNLIGTIFVCNDIIRKAAAEKNISFEKEFLFIVCHGIDHLVGIHHK